MGMTCTLRRVNENDLRRLREAPEQIFKFLHGDPVPLEEVREPGLTSFILRFLGVKTEQVSPTAIEDDTESEAFQSADQIDLDKAWDPLHFLFTGTAGEGPEPACFLLCGGEEIGDEDVGPARVLRPDQVSQFAAFLAGLSRDELARRYNPERMTALGIYSKSRGSSAARDESDFEFLFQDLEELRDFISATSTRGDSVIISII